MRKNFLLRPLTVVGGLMLLLFFTLLLVSRNQALELVYHPAEARSELAKTPADFDLDYADVFVQSTDGIRLYGWYIPSRNGAAVVLQHGYKSNRSELLEEAEMLSRQGYGVLLSSVRAHDQNSGELIGFGLHEMSDLDAWFNFLGQQDDIDPKRIGLLGNSLGGTMAAQYAAMNEEVRALVLHSAFSSMRDTIDTSIRYFTGLPAFPFAQLIRFWAEREIKGSIEDIDATTWVSQLSPRPVLILHSTTDIVISEESGDLLFAAARQPKEIWLAKGVEHASFDTQSSLEFESRVLSFFNRYLLGLN
jgi:fermentation-respiration switch protein FrsA (DUF1100 family)